MPWRTWLARWLPLAAVGAILLGLLDPLEGFPVLLIGSVLTVMASIQRESRHTRLAVWAMVLAGCGAAALVGISAMGGVGPVSGRSYWWLLLAAPYPVGLLISLICAVLILRAPSGAH